MLSRFSSLLRDIFTPLVLCSSRLVRASASMDGWMDGADHRACPRGASICIIAIALLQRWLYCFAHCSVPCGSRGICAFAFYARLPSIRIRISHSRTQVLDCIALASWLAVVMVDNLLDSISIGGWGFDVDVGVFLLLFPRDCEYRYCWNWGRSTYAYAVCR